TRSMRALLVDLKSGEELGYLECKYPHQIMETALPDGTKLGADWALQHPEDYLFALTETVPKLLREYGVDGSSVVGIGLDFTASTVMPLNEDFVPLCCLDEFRRDPHAYVKLWKHHSALYCADRMTQLAKETGEPWLKRIGGKVSSEFCFPKLLQIALEAPQVFDRMEYFMEAGDYIVSILTGQLSRSACIAGFKSYWTPEEGYPSEAFLNRLNPNFGTKALKTLRGSLIPPGESAGTLTKEFAEKLGLSEKTVVASAVIDAHAAVPSAGILGDNQMQMILGTSGCHISLSKTYREVEGACGIVKNGVIDGFYCYESGQSGMGDLFEWLMRTCVTKEVENVAKEKGMSVLDHLADLASKQAIGEHGLLCLDWFNGNRSVLTDSDLSGMILGLTLATKPEDLYRAFVEAVAFGTRKILENYENAGVPVDQLYATGTISKSPFMMQAFSDVLGKEIKLVASQNGPALGSAIFAAAASGHLSLVQATEKLGKTKEEFYKPNFERKLLYDKLYREYCTLHDYFGRGINPVLKKLKALRKG
ncbi:MAG: ribulokinase, partial [Clostridia bacterium]|nr:ribulokinase [Clostridia bacterium]